MTTRTVRTFTRGPEQSLLIDETIRVQVISSSTEHLRLLIDAGPGIDIVEEEQWEPLTGRRRDLLSWHPTPARVAKVLVDHFGCDPNDVRPIGCGVAYFGHDACLYTRMCEFVQGYRSAESSG